jgi:hypothetical protein
MSTDTDDLMNISMEDFEDYNLSDEDLEVINQEPDEEIDSKEEPQEDSEEEIEDNDRTPVDTSDDEDAEKQTDDDENIFKTFASALVEAGVLSTKDETSLEKIKSFDELKEIIREEIRGNEFADLNEQQKEYLEKLSKGLTHEEVVAINNEKSLLTKLEESDLEENEELRRQLIYSDFLSKGYSEERAKKLTERSFETLSDLEDAQEALRLRKESLKATEKQLEEQRQKDLENAKKEYETRIEQIKTTLFDETKEIIKGVKVNQTVAKRVFDNITKPVKHDEQGRPVSKIVEARMKNPVDFDIKLNLIYELTDGFTKVDAFLNQGKQSAIKSFDEKLKTTTFTKGTNATSFRVDPNFDKVLDFFEKSNK